jgi:kynurenine formamidase
MPQFVAALALTLGLAAPCIAADTLADALRIIQGKELVDLTHSFSPATPVWSGFGQATMSAACDTKTLRPFTIERDGFRTTFYSMVGQYGTHVDPPAHFRSDGMTMDEIPLKQMILPLVVLDITPMLTKDPNHALTIDDVKTWEKVHGTIPAGAFAALRTDMSKDWTAKSRAFQTLAVSGVVACGHQVSIRRAEGDGDRTRVARHRYDRDDGFRDVDPEAESLSDRGDGES